MRRAATRCRGWYRGGRSGPQCGVEGGRLLVPGCSPGQREDHGDLHAGPAVGRDGVADQGRAADHVDGIDHLTGKRRPARRLFRRPGTRPDLERIWRARLASAEVLNSLADDRATAERRADAAFHAQTIGVATSAAVCEAMVAARQATMAQAAGLRRWLIAPGGTRQPGAAQPPPPSASPESTRRADRGLGRWLARLGLPDRAATVIATDASLRPVWFLNSARGAGALAAAVAVAKLTDVQHAFWVVLGTLSVLRTSAAATGSTAMRALAGTIAGFVIGAALLLAIGTNPVALWIAFPLAVLVAAYTPGTAPWLHDRAGHQADREERPVGTGDGRDAAAAHHAFDSQPADQDPAALRR